MSPVPILSLIILTSFGAALIVALLPAEPVTGPRRAAFFLSLVPLLFSLWMLARFDPAVGTLQLVETAPWIPSLGVNYALGVDGFSLWLVLLTTFLTPLTILASWTDIQKRVRGFMALLLVMEGTVVGALLATDLMLFFFFWEFMLIPMAFLIGIWGGPKRRYAAIKFVLYTMVGSALMFVAMLYVVLRGRGPDGALTFDIVTLYGITFTPREEFWLFSAFALAFMIKVPMFPLHTWLPDAHTEAPTGGSVDLAGVLLKMGAYGFLRFALPLFPSAAQDGFGIIMALSVVGIIYGALVAYPQPDMKRLVAYSSVSHMGFIMLGLYAFNWIGISGGVLQMINHGLSTGALFIMIGFIYDRRHTREIEAYGGIWGIVPIFSALFLVVVLSSVGLPGLNGFVGEFLIMVGAFRSHPVAAVLATLGVILGAVYLLTMYQRVVFGPVRHEETRHLTDLNGREIFVAACFIAAIVWIGVYPRPVLSRIEPTVDVLLARLERAGATRHLERAHGPAVRALDDDGAAVAAR